MSRHASTETTSDDRPAARRTHRARRGLTIVAMAIALPGIVGTASASALTSPAAAGACYLGGVETSNGGEVRMPSGTIKTCRDGRWVAE